MQSAIQFGIQQLHSVLSANALCINIKTLGMQEGLLQVVIQSHLLANNRVLQLCEWDQSGSSGGQEFLDTCQLTGDNSS